jgi:hypothetical protein
MTNKIEKRFIEAPLTGINFWLALQREMQICWFAEQKNAVEQVTKGHASARLLLPLAPSRSFDHSSLKVQCHSAAHKYIVQVVAGD